MNYRIWVGWVAICGTLIALGCNGQHPKTVKTSVAQDTVIKGNFNLNSNLKFDSIAIDSFLKIRPAFKEFAADFRKLYRLHDFNYLWYDKSGTPEATSNLINHLETQENNGILKSLPYRDDFLKMVDELQTGNPQKPRVEVELMFTAQYFNYAKNVWGGAQADHATDIGWFLPKKKLNYADLLQQQFAGPKSNIEHLAVVPQYIALKNALNSYQQKVKEGDDIRVLYNRELNKLIVGDSSGAIRSIRNRLVQLGDLGTRSGSNIYDEELEKAVIHFKNRHGIRPVGKLDANFIKQLNIPLHQRVEQIIVNLERMRWIPVDDHGGEFILVNIPEYKLHYYEDNKLVWDCKVVVGKLMAKTVIFSGRLDHIVFSPYWYIPASIIEKEIKPGIARNANYLANHNMEWNDGHVRQKPGYKNSLGLVKFIFPNSNNIYLHDTPSKPLFDEDNRAFSHGCIRVSEPAELARRALRQLPSWSPAKIDKAMHAGREQTVVLPKKIPVYIGYFTAFVNSQGELNFRDDIYQRDQKLLNSLMKTD